MKVKSYIQSRKTKYEQNRVFIQKVVRLSELEYCKTVFESGAKFLETLYPYGSEYEQYRRIILRDKKYWMWWKAEFKKYEQQIIEIDEGNLRTEYKGLLLLMPDLYFIKDSFYHSYTKRIAYEL
jgi:hypothetical protein